MNNARNQNPKEIGTNTTSPCLFSQYLRKCIQGTVILSCLTLTTGASAALMTLADTPLFLGAAVLPNVFFVLDDSGSMDWEITTQPHNHHCMYDLFATSNTKSSSDCGSITDDAFSYVYVSGGESTLAYIFPNTDNLYGITCSSDGISSFESCTVNSSQTKEWRVYSSDLNVSMYNPGSNYTPWLGPCTLLGAACTDASITAARSNPREGTTGYLLTRNLTGTEGYNVWIDDKGYSGTRPRRGNNVNVTTGANGQIDLWDSYVNFLFKDASKIEVRTNVFSPTKTTMGLTSTLKATLSGSACYNILGPQDDVRTIFKAGSSYTATDGPNCRTVADAQTNFANWYQYTRKRSLMAKWAISEVIGSQPTWRYGMTVINAPSVLFTQMPPASTTDMTAFIKTFLGNMYSYAWQAYGTPLQIGLDNAGKYYMGTYPSKPSPIILSCQQNFSILMTDGYWNGGNPSSYIADSDGDGKSLTVADVARYYYKTDISSLPNNVPPNSFDTATWQHMVTFTVAFGVKGLLVDTDGDGWPNPALAENGNWGNPYNSDIEKVDDLWHAAYNSRGRFASAASPEEFIGAIKENFRNIASRVGSVSSAAQNASTLSSTSAVYQAKFDSGNWIGDLLSYPISVTGVLSSTPSWSAQCLLTGGTCTSPSGSFTAMVPSNRVIITRDWATNGYLGIPFRFPTNYTTLKSGTTYPENMVALMAKAPYAITTSTASEITRNQTYGQNLVNYLRGERSQEQNKGGTEAFRNRIAVLGDIVNSDPIYVGPPARNYEDTFEAVPYSTYKTAKASRPGVIYVGANDGMLHGFDATTGAERLAYVPGALTLYQNLPNLSINPLVHKYFVNGAPIEGDLFFGGAWHTYLAGGLKSGGRGVYALDISDPSTFTEANANQILAFEFTAKDDKDLGYTYSDMRIVKMNNNKWALIFGNGYNNSESGTYASTTGRAAIYVLFIDGSYNGTWTLNTNYKKFLVGPTNVTTPNGMSSVYPVDDTGNFKVDYLYGADLLGNIWKIDVTSSDPNKWGVATANDTTPFFSAKQTTAGDQPITGPITVTRHPTGVGYMIYFGTGKYLEAADNTTTGQTTQSYYAIWDKKDGTLPLKTQLVQQQILGEFSQGFDTNGDGVVDTTYQLRYTSANTISWTSAMGWYMDLKVATSSTNNGERMVAKSILRNGHVVFTTIVPSTDPCSAGGISWLMELDAASGARLNSAPFDLTGEGSFTVADFVNVGSSSSPNFVSPGGVQSSTGLSATPTVFLAPDKSKEVKVISGTSGLKSMGETTNSKYLGRQNWRQLK